VVGLSVIGTLDGTKGTTLESPPGRPEFARAEGGWSLFTLLDWADRELAKLRAEGDISKVLFVVVERAEGGCCSPWLTFVAILGGVCSAGFVEKGVRTLDTVLKDWGCSWTERTD
jgi:hypothetical protein